MLYAAAGHGAGIDFCRPLRTILSAHFTQISEDQVLTFVSET
jgi:hypothetical protein